MRYQCALKGLDFYAFHGLYGEEKKIGGHFMVDVAVTLEIPEHKRMDSLDQVVNYEVLFRIVKEEMENRRDLIEAVAESILDQVQAHFSGAKETAVTITKKNPAGLFNNGNAVVTLNRS